jgi:hypothetical protein
VIVGSKGQEILAAILARVALARREEIGGGSSPLQLRKPASSRDSINDRSVYAVARRPRRSRDAWANHIPPRVADDHQARAQAGESLVVAALIR